MEDWIFASPIQLGRLPWSYDQVWRVYQKAGAQAGIGGLGTHSLRHTYRSWLDAVGTSVAVQQKADAACRYPDDHEHLRRHRDGRNDRSQWESNPVSLKWQVEWQVSLLTS
jgi:integrase